MQKFYEYVTLGAQIEHDSEHDSLIKKKYSIPKINNFKGDLKKRWYVYFSYRNPETGKLERMNNIYGKANNYSTKEERNTILLCYRKNLIKLLKEGYSPFDGIPEDLEMANDTTPLVEVGKSIDSSGQEQKKEVLPSSSIHVDMGMTIEEAMEFALELKKRTVSARTLQDYTYKKNSFLQYLSDNEKNVKYIKDLDKSIVLSFLNHILLKSSARNRNNYRADLSALFQLLEENSLIDKNFLKHIQKLKSKPVKNRPFDENEIIDIFRELKDVDPLMLLYVKFVYYNLLRPIEINRLLVKDINLSTKTITFRAKNKTSKEKIIPEVLLKDIPDFSDLNPMNHLFTPTGLGQIWETNENQRRDYFTKRFNKIKTRLGYDSRYGLYSFRHSAIKKLYSSSLKHHSPHAAKSNIMLITGHTSMASLEKYLRDLDAELPDDYSNLMTTNQ